MLYQNRVHYISEPTINEFHNKISKALLRSEDSNSMMLQRECGEKFDFIKLVDLELDITMSILTGEYKDIENYCNKYNQTGDLIKRINNF
jgi:hypothetical protein